MSAGTEAGGTLVIVAVLLAYLGHLAGELIGLPAAGTVAGGFVGLIAGFAATYVRYRDL